MAGDTAGDVRAHAPARVERRQVAAEPAGGAAVEPGAGRHPEPGIAQPAQAGVVEARPEVVVLVAAPGPEAPGRQVGTGPQAEVRGVHVPVLEAPDPPVV